MRKLSKKAKAELVEKKLQDLKHAFGEDCLTASQWERLKSDLAERVGTGWDALITPSFYRDIGE